NRLATGNKVNSALDNPSSFFTAAALNSRAADMSNLLDSMASGIKVIEAANNGITALTKNMESMQSTLRQARQDKSFSTKSFDVNDSTKINLGGGQFGDLNADISLASATVAGTKAQISTEAATAYLGPQSTTAGAQGAGARSVITLGSPAGFTTGDTFSVAGVTVTAGADVTAAGLKATIQTTLDAAPATTAKYAVSVGTGDNAGKIIIETVDPSAAAAAINLDPDNNAATGVNNATKGAVTFNYSAVSTSITAGGQSVATGATFDDFVANLQAKATAGGYTVEADATTKDIKLTSTQWGGAVPTVAGVPNYSPGTPATKASSVFTIGTSNGAQNLTIAGASGPIAIASGATDAQVLSALQGDANINANYDITNTGSTFTLTAKTAGAATAPTVTSDKTYVAAAVASDSGTLMGTVDFTSTGTNLQAYAGQTISVGAQSYTFTAGGDNTTQATALKTALEGGSSGLTVTLTTTGFSITKADGTDFSISTTGTLGTAIGATAGTLDVTNGSPLSAGINGAVTSNNGQPMVPEIDGVQTATVTAQGASVATVAAEKNTFTVSYDGKTANVSIGGVKGGVGTPVNALDIKNWQDATIASVNSDLEAAGITGVEAKFDAAGKFQLVGKTAEAKTLAVSGDDATALFGTNGVNTGVAEKSQLNATKTVDKFVELINRDHGGKVRASNDNGKLRIENLSTQALDIGVDTNGNGAVNALKIDGNSVRANLSKQFNELRDQLDKLADDSSFNGINLLRGDKLKITFNESGTSSIDIQAKDANGNTRGINASNLGVESLVAEDLDTDEKIDAFLGKLSSALTELRSQASAFGSNLSSVENRQSFTKNMINTLETGAANLTLADTNEEAANLLALQTRQQLSSSALSMASQQDQAVLQLLR
ncbi:flagellin, partial [Devosia sp. Leaf64]|uniref:flagellin N-terminal helical domain-containing protein n=2 Tax=Devosia TaxID=46913 RepID=UPI0019107208